MMASSSKGVKRRIREFKVSWLDDNCFKGWLTPHPSENRALCMACNTTISCRKTDLIRHSQTVKHIDKVKSLNFEAIDNNNNNNKSHNSKVKSAEIKLATFFAEHNIGFSIVNHLIPLIKDIFNDSEIAQDISLARTKCSHIIKNIIAKRETEKIVDNLKTRYFSILIDESTDISDHKVMCTLARYVSPLNNKITTQLLDLTLLDATDCSANKIFDSFKNLLEEKKIPIKNIVGLACDNASVMVGCNNSFMTHLKSQVPGLITLNCICHSSALVTSKACDKLPLSCKNVVKEIATYISGSAKRCAILGEFQDFFNVERHKILKLSNTRWLSLKKCVDRLLENWEPLKNYFILEVVEEKSKSAENILQNLNNNCIKAYLLFLKYSLNFLNNFNAHFQSRNILIHKLYGDSQQLIIQFANNFVNFNVLDNIFNLDLNDKNNIRHVDDIYVGPDCESFLKTLPLECMQQIKFKCLEFYVTAVQEMLKRLPCKDILFQQLTFLDPQIALYDQNRIKISDLTYIATRIQRDINITQLNYEWKILPSTFDEHKKKELASLETDEMWKNILECKNSDDTKIFPNLKFLVEIVLSLPHSNAEAERIFSIVTDVKNKKRNRLSNDTVSAICVIRSSFQDANINCTNFQVDARHLELHTANLYREQRS